MKGSLSQKNSPNPEAFERSNYVKTLANFIGSAIWGKADWSGENDVDVRNRPLLVICVIGGLPEFQPPTAAEACSAGLSGSSPSHGGTTGSNGAPAAPSAARPPPFRFFARFARFALFF